MKTDNNSILILDFGSQYTQLIARRIREEHVYCEIHPCTLLFEEICSFKPKGIILSGGPSSVLEPDAPMADKRIFGMEVPILGICYGMQFIAHILGGSVVASDECEYGSTRLLIKDFNGIFNRLKGRADDDGLFRVWMSHGDRIESFPPDFKLTASSANAPVAAMMSSTHPFFGVQFHPEVAHTTLGQDILRGFIFDVCKCRPTWTMNTFIEQAVIDIQKQVGKEKLICALSGGVDSSVVAVLLNRAIGAQLTCVFVNNGLLRRGEAEQVRSIFSENFNINFHYIDASDRFLKRLDGVSDPEKKRKIIGNLFIDVFEEEAKRIKGVTFLAQGTLYPDVIESLSFKGPSATIKSHHNVGGLPEKMDLKLVEPLRELFKDEVRELGRELGLPNELVMRHPFPGPALSIRILGPISEQRLKILRRADQIVEEEMRINNLYNKVWQGFAVLLPVKTVGVMGDSRTYEYVIAIRIVDSLEDRKSVV